MVTRLLVAALAVFSGACATAPPAPLAPSPDPMLIADVRISIRPDATADFADAMGPFLTQSRAVAGNLDFQLLRVDGAPHRYVLLERWSSRAAFDAYLASDAFSAFRTDVGPLLAGPPESAYYEATAADREVVR